MMISDEQAKRLLRDMDNKKGKLLYVFMDEQEKVLHSQWYPNDQFALRVAEFVFKGKVLNVLRYIGSSEES